MNSVNIFFENYFNEFEELFLSIGEKVTLKEGTTISSFDKDLYLYYIQDGIFILRLEHEEGLSKAFCYHSIGCINPYSPARPQNGEFKIDLDYFIITALTEVNAIRIKPEVFYQSMLENPHLSIVMIDYIIDHSNLYLMESLHLSYNSAFTKTCNFVYIYTQHLMKYGIRLTQSEIGDFIGETRLEVARAMQKLRKMNIVETSRYSIKVLDIERLKKLRGS